jgi:hypothetical protein
MTTSSLIARNRVMTSDAITIGKNWISLHSGGSNQFVFEGDPFFQALEDAVASASEGGQYC